MQKILSTHFLALYSSSRRILSDRKAGLIVAMALLLLTGFANQAKASSGFFKNYIIINGKYYQALSDGTDTSNPNFSTVGNLGSFDRGNGVILLGGEANTYNDNGDDIQAAQLLYRVYREFTTPPATLTPVSLNFQGVSGNNKKWSNTNGVPNLVTSTSGTGHYIVELFFQAQGTYNNSGGSGSFTISDNTITSPYRFSFDVTGSVPAQWTGNSDGNWFNAANWSTGQLPTKDTDVTITYPSSVYPTIGGVTADIATVRTLNIAGNPAGSGALGAIVTLSGNALQIYGDFRDSNGGLKQTGGIFALSGANQTFDGGTFSQVEIDGGGTKSLNGRMLVNGYLSFGSGILATRTDNPSQYGVVLGAGAEVRQEGDPTSNGGGYVLGVIQAIDRIVEIGTANSFGNIGADLTAKSGSNTTVVVTRISRIYNGVGTSVSVRRAFLFTPVYAPGAVTIQDFDLTFHYVNADLNGIAVSNLVLFRSVTSGNIPFAPLSRTSIDAVNKTLTRTGITNTLAALFTLGDAANPLPVTVTNFAAVAQGPNALLTWTTAQELNNSGFEVQVSTDGTTFSKLGFVAAASPNSTLARTYQYSDVTANKQGTRYYRLRQLDVNGKEGLFGPQSLTFGGALATSVKGYPNPFASEINLALQTVAAGQATVSVLDGVGRQLRSWQPTLAAGTSNLVLSDLTSLPHGLYMVQVRYSDGQTQRLKVVKD